MYGVAGERRLTELELPWLAGYEGSRPVRIATRLRPADSSTWYGEVVDALYQSRRQGLPPSDDAWRLSRKLLGWLESGGEPDEGYGSAWPTSPLRTTPGDGLGRIDRAVKTIERFGRDGPLDRCVLSGKDQGEVLREGYDPRRGSFVQFYGSDRTRRQPASDPLVRFLPAMDERVIGTVRAIEKELLRDGFVERYARTTRTST